MKPMVSSQPSSNSKSEHTSFGCRSGALPGLFALTCFAAASWWMVLRLSASFTIRQGRHAVSAALSATSDRTHRFAPPSPDTGIRGGAAAACRRMGN